MVLGTRAAQLQARMPVKTATYASDLLLSPMPGLLTEIAVAVGQEVGPGDRLAVIEAMKMENVLRAEKPAVVADVLAMPGESLAVGQAILRFRRTTV